MLKNLDELFFVKIKYLLKSLSADKNLLIELALIPEFNLVIK